MTGPCGRSACMRGRLVLGVEGTVGKQRAVCRGACMRGRLVLGV